MFGIIYTQYMVAIIYYFDHSIPWKLDSGDRVMKIITNNFYEFTTPNILKLFMKTISTLLINTTFENSFFIMVWMVEFVIFCYLIINRPINS